MEKEEYPSDYKSHSDMNAIVVSDKKTTHHGLFIPSSQKIVIILR